MFGKVAKRQIVMVAMSGSGRSLVSKVCHQFASLPPAPESPSMFETKFANCECDCRSILQLLSWLTAAVVVLGLCSLSMLFITLYFFKKSRAQTQAHNVEMAQSEKKVTNNQHKINSFTCLELKEISRNSLNLAINKC